MGKVYDAAYKTEVCQRAVEGGNLKAGKRPHCAGDNDGTDTCGAQKV